MRPRILFLAALALLGGCGSPTEKEHSGKGRYGGVFNLNEAEDLRSIFPLSLTQVSAFRIAAQIYQGLVRFDPKGLSVKPCLATSWDVDPTSTIYTFHLRTGVRFHDDPAFTDGMGREMKADDVVRCFNTICTQELGAPVFWLFQDLVKGANVHYAASAQGKKPATNVEGIEALDERTVRITLTHPAPNFLQIIAHPGCWIWPHELLEAHGDDLLRHAIGTGPFFLKTAHPGSAMVLERAPHYWEKDADGNTLPYLDAVKVTFVEDAGQELDEFLKGHLTAVFALPVDRVGVLADSVGPQGTVPFVLRSAPALETQYYGFNLMRPPFNDLRVRRAFAMAIDRKALVDSVLRGMAVPAEHGLVAPGLAGYPYELVHAVPYEPDSARALLAAAGYPGGKGFPPVTIQVNNDGFGYVQVAEAVQDQLQRELHIPISQGVLPYGQYYDRMELGQLSIWRNGWVADHPDAANFLALLYGKNAVADTTLPSTLNSTRYQDAVFDSLFTTARATTNAQHRANLLAMAERRALSDLPLLPLYHDRAMLLMRPWVRGLTINPIEYLDLSAVWLDRTAMPKH